MGMQRIDNPSNVPQSGVVGVTNGYQRQNTQIFAARVGLDTTAPFDNGAAITVPAGGVVEVNGVLYTVSSGVSVAKPVAGRAYWLAVVPSPDGATAAFQLVERPGVWDPARNGCYFTSGAHNNRRTLNWVSRGALANIPAGTGGAYSRTMKTDSDIISLPKGWYIARVASGLGGPANGGDANNQNGGLGGLANSRNLLDLIFFAGKPLYQVRVGGNGLSGGNGANGAIDFNSASGGGRRRGFRCGRGDRV